MKILTCSDEVGWAGILVITFYCQLGQLIALRMAGVRGMVQVSMC